MLEKKNPAKKQNLILTVQIPEWTLVAAQINATPPAVIHHCEQIVAANYAAKQLGITEGQTLALANTYCNGLKKHPYQASQTQKTFHAITQEIRQHYAYFRTLRPGVIQIKWPKTHRGRSLEEVAFLTEALANLGYETKIGLAAGSFLSYWCAQEELLLEDYDEFTFQQITDSLPIEQVERFLAVSDPLSIFLPWEKEIKKAGETWQLLGIEKIQDLKRLGRNAITQRFGRVGGEVYDLIVGDDQKLPALLLPATVDPVISCFDPPCAQIDQVIFQVKKSLEQLHSQLQEQQLMCSQLQIEARSENGQWWTEKWLLPGGVEVNEAWEFVNRKLLRWQRNHIWRTQDGWQQLRLTAVQTQAASRQAPTLLNYQSVEEQQRRSRKLLTISENIGSDKLLVPTLISGYDPESRIRLLPWQPQTKTEQQKLRDGKTKTLPRTVTSRSGQYHLPAPEIVYFPRLEGELFDRNQKQIRLDQNGQLLNVPYRLLIGKENYPISSYAGPWLINGHWWSSQEEPTLRPKALLYLQCPPCPETAENPSKKNRTETGTAISIYKWSYQSKGWLLTGQDGRWYVQGQYQQEQSPPSENTNLDSRLR